MESFGVRVAGLRTGKHMSQMELATRLNIAKSTLGMYETDKREPNFEIVQRIANIFDVSTDYLITGAESSIRESHIPYRISDNGQMSQNSDDKRPMSENIGRSTVEIQRAVDRSKSVINGYIQDIRKDDTLFGIAGVHKVTFLKLLGTIRAGYDLYADEQLDGVWPVPDYLIADGAEYFCLKVQGDSMIGDNIRNGDVILVRRQDYIEEGKVAVVLVNGDEATLKRITYQGNLAILQSSNPDKYPPRAIPADDIRIQGRAMNRVALEEI